jgi:hypothetical protein
VISFCVHAPAAPRRTAVLFIAIALLATPIAADPPRLYPPPDYLTPYLQSVPRIRVCTTPVTIRFVRQGEQAPAAAPSLILPSPEATPLNLHTALCAPPPSTAPALAAGVSAMPPSPIRLGTLSTAASEP